MEELLAAAFVMGMLGSVHCIGMCGPLALALPLREDSNWSKFCGVLLYNTGRVITYAIAGTLFGLVGKTAGFFGYQQLLSIVLGACILVAVILPKAGVLTLSGNSVSQWLVRLRSRLGDLFLQRNYRSLFFIGLLNGLLPCGLVYMAATGATATGGIASGALFMAFFGLGTIPAMWCVSFFGNFIGLSFRKTIRKAYPYVLAVMATLLILRGMGLDIPYISPAISAEKTPVCCHKP